jgi:hypothetical protein
MSDKEILELLQELSQLKLKTLTIVRQQLFLFYSARLSLLPSVNGQVESNSFHSGDKFVITNKARKPLNRTTNNGYRTGTVITIQQNRINILTSTVHIPGAHQINFDTDTKTSEYVAGSIASKSKPLPVEEVLVAEDQTTVAPCHLNNRSSNRNGGRRGQTVGNNYVPNSNFKGNTERECL